MTDSEVEYGGKVLPPDEKRIDNLEREENIRLRRMTVLATLWPFSASNLMILALFFWKAYAVHGNLSDRTLMWLAGITISQNASIVVICVKDLFQSRAKGVAAISSKHISR
jgi:hypothetical protein